MTNIFFPIITTVTFVILLTCTQGIGIKCCEFGQITLSLSLSFPHLKNEDNNNTHLNTEPGTEVLLNKY